MASEKNNFIRIIKPTYYDKFSCIGPACTDNCCHTWQINIDKSHYLQYQHVKNPEFRKIFQENVSLCKETSNSHYASIGLKDNLCSFQDKDGGCKIYRLLGEEALCDTCTVYPRRRARSSSDTWELSLSLSCMEAARLCLFDCGPVSFTSTDHEIEEHDPLLKIPLIDLHRQGKSKLPHTFIPALRLASLELIQCQNYTLAERILAVGVLMRRVDRLILSGSASQIPETAKQFVFSVQKGDFHGFFDRLDYIPEAHLSALQLPLTHLLAGFRTPVLKHIMDLLLPYCAKNPDTEEYQAGKPAVAFLLDLLESYDQIYFAKYSQALENYFVNYLFSSLFPFLYHTEGLSFEQNGVLLAEQYSLLRILFSLFCHADKESGDKQLIQAVVALSRSSQHADLGADLLKLIHTVKFGGFAHAAYLLR